MYTQAAQKVYSYFFIHFVYENIKKYPLKVVYFREFKKKSMQPRLCTIGSNVEEWWRAPPQEIFHSNNGIAVLQKAWNSALDYSKNIIIIIIILENTKFFELSIYNNESSTDFCW